MATTLSLTSFLSLVPRPQSRNAASPLHFTFLSSSRETHRSISSSVVMAAAESADGRSSSSVAASFPAELTAVMNPSAAYANNLFFKSAYNVQVIVDENEPEERLLNRFRREVMKAGVIQECKRRKFFENKQDEKKRKTREAAKRNRRRRPQTRSLQQNKQEASSRKKDDEEEDNWDLPEDLDTSSLP